MCFRECACKNERELPVFSRSRACGVMGGTGREGWRQRSEDGSSSGSKRKTIDDSGHLKDHTILFDWVTTEAMLSYADVFAGTAVILNKL